MARASETEQTGAIGINETLGKFERIGFGHAEVIHHDNGSDVFLLIRDVRRFDLGLTLAAQVKGGDSWFKRPSLAGDDTVLGYWFEDSDGDHIADWANFGLPHLLVMYDVNGVTGATEAYWVEVTGQNVRSTGVGSKILVPATQKVDEDSREALVALSAKGRPAQLWEGSNWRGAASLASRDVIRHALIAPRLIAPHPNAGIGASLTAEQAIALTVQARIADLEEAAKKGHVPTVEDASASAKWLWKFYAALRRRLTAGELQPLIEVSASADGATHTSAAVAATAGCLFEEDRADEAINLLEAAIEDDIALPIDHAWLSVQLARGYWETGHIARARELTRSVLVIAATHAHDVTATSIAGIAANLLFRMQDITDPRSGPEDLVSAIEGSDTAVNWWRQQVTGWATIASLEREFISWSHDTTTRWSRWDAANSQLLSASLSATLAGDSGSWSALSGLLAKDLLIRLRRDTDPSTARGALSVLRIAGQERDIPLAARRFIEDGPASAVATAAAEIRLDLLTHRTAQSSLVLLRVAGCVLDPSIADATVEWILATLRDPSAFAERTHPSFILDAQLVETLGSVLQSATAASQRSLAEFIGNLDPLGDDLLEQKWLVLVGNIDPGEWTEEQATAAAARTGDATPEFRDALVATLAGRSPAAMDAAIEALTERGQPALGAWREVSTLPDQTVDRIISGLADHLAKRREQAAANEGHTVWAYDHARNLAVLNVHRPAEARWPALVDYLVDPHMTSLDKAPAFGVLSVAPHKLPAEHRDALRDAAIATLKRIDDDLLRDEQRGAVHGRLRQFLDATGSSTGLPDSVLGLLAQGDRDDRIWAARITGLTAERAGTIAEGLLLVLANDADPHVRGSAVAALVEIAAQSPTSTAQLVSAIEHASKDGGLIVPLALADGLAAFGTVPAALRDITVRLREHACRPVRERALKAVIDE